jgi:hypothetical protein
MNRVYVSKRKILLPLLVVLVIFNSCAVKWVADYRKDIEDAVVEVAKKIDKYYADLTSTTGEDGTVHYTTDLTKEQFEKRFREIDTELYGIYLRNQSRPLNSESAQISKNILDELWRKYNGDIGTNKPLLEIHRKRFTRNFEALLRAEKVLEGAN